MDEVFENWFSLFQLGTHVILLILMPLRADIVVHRLVSNQTIALKRKVLFRFHVITCRHFAGQS